MVMSILSMVVPQKLSSVPDREGHNKHGQEMALLGAAPEQQDSTSSVTKECGFSNRTG